MTGTMKSAERRGGAETPKYGSDMLLVYLVMAAATVGLSLTLHHPSSTVDEMGFFANSALLSGHDWSDAVHASGDYYFKYGMALFYTLPFMLIRDSILRYRTCLIIGDALLSLTAPCVYYIARKYFRIEKRTDAILMTLIASCAPSVMYQGIYARADWALVLMSWIVLLAVLQAMSTENGKERIFWSISAGLGAMFAFACHTRGIVLVIALFLTVLFFRICFSVRTVHLPALFLTLGLSAAADRFLTGFFKSRIWGSYGAGHASAEALDLSYLKFILTADGFKVFVKSVTGWLHSMCTSTMGVVMIGLVACFVAVFAKKGLLSLEERVASFFGVLNFIGNMALGLLFFYKVLYRNFHNLSSSRADRMMYERYMICAVGIVMLIGLALLTRKEIMGKGARLAAFAFSAAIAAFAFLRVVPYYGFQKADRKFMVSATFFYRWIKDRPKALILAGIVALAVFAVWMLLEYLGHRKSAYVILIACYAGILLVTWKDWRGKMDRSVLRSIQPLYETVMSVDGLAEAFPEIYVEKKAQSPKILQPVFLDFNVSNRKVRKAGSLDNALVVVRGGMQQPEAWGTLYRFKGMDYSSKKRTAAYVKGEELRAYLEAHGIELEEAVPAHTGTLKSAGKSS